MLLLLSFPFANQPPPLLFFGGAEGEGGRLGEITEFGVLFCRS